MKTNPLLKLFSLALLAILSLNSCKKDKPDNSPVITLSTDNVTGKSGQMVSVTVHVLSPIGIKSMVITKGVNLVADPSYGNQGNVTVNPQADHQNELNYTFTYQFSPAEVDKLVGFNFKVLDLNGDESEKDLTVNTTVSAAQLLYSYKWNLKGKFNETSNAPDFTDCEKDDFYLFNANGSMQYGYGASACTFDGFNVYNGWSLSEDEKVLTITYSSLFDPSKVTVEKYNVRSLTRDRLIIDMAYDLTVFGLSAHEVYVFTYDASNK